MKRNTDNISLVPRVERLGSATAKSTIVVTLGVGVGVGVGEGAENGGMST